MPFSGTESVPYLLYYLASYPDKCLFGHSFCDPETESTYVSKEML